MQFPPTTASLVTVTSWTKSALSILAEHLPKGAHLAAPSDTVARLLTGELSCNQDAAAVWNPVLVE